MKRQNVTKYQGSAAAVAEQSEQGVRLAAM